jgi:hypothetical protein
VNSNRFSFSLAMLTRRAIQAIAKSYFLMSNDDPGELLTSDGSLTVAELSVSSKHNQFVTRDRTLEI